VRQFYRAVAERNDEKRQAGSQALILAIPWRGLVTTQGLPALRRDLLSSSSLSWWSGAA
jgi:hypothetical protein